MHCLGAVIISASLDLAELIFSLTQSMNVRGHVCHVHKCAHAEPRTHERKPRGNHAQDNDRLTFAAASSLSMMPPNPNHTERRPLAGVQAGVCVTVATFVRVRVVCAQSTINGDSKIHSLVSAHTHMLMPKPNTGPRPDLTATHMSGFLSGAGESVTCHLNPTSPLTPPTSPHRSGAVPKRRRDFFTPII